MEHSSGDGELIKSTGFIVAKNEEVIGGKKVNRRDSEF